MTYRPFEVPAEWSLSPQQECVIGTLMDDAGHFTTAGQFCEALYGEGFDKGPAPAKLRVLMQRCRAIIQDKSHDKVTILIKRNSGWKLTKKSRLIFLKIIAEDE